MDEEDREILRNERDANSQFTRANSHRTLETSYGQLRAPGQPRNVQEGSEPVEEAEETEETEEVETPLSHKRGNASRTTSVVSTQRPSARYRPSTLSRTSTDKENSMMEYLDRHPTVIKRIEEHRLQHSLTVGSKKAHVPPEADLPPFGGDKPYPPLLPDHEDYVVEFNGPDDLAHPKNWPTKKKIYITGILIFNALAATLGSSIFTAAATFVGEEFHQGSESTTLATSLFVLGYAVGPITFAPLSELYGRKPPIVICTTAFGIFNIAVAVAKDYQTIMICRFFAGFFGSCSLSVVPAVFSDIYSNKHRGIAIATFSAVLFCGPFTGPTIGGFISKSYLGWRWTSYLVAIIAFAGAILDLFFQEESYPPVILQWKASDLRRRTRNWGIHAKQDEVEVDLKQLVVQNLGRPMRILFTEPIVLLVTLYMSFIYGLIYLSFTAYDFIFAGVHGFSPGVSGLPYMALIVGVMFAFVFLLWQNSWYSKKLEENNDIPVPEWRLGPCMIGGFIFTAGLFWLGWTGYTDSIPWIVPTLSGLFIGFGVFTIFVPALNYIIDAYLMFAASAIAANTIMRSLFGAVFPLFASYMYEGIGIQWGMTFLGCVAALFIPVPFIFNAYGKGIRSKSKFAPALDIKQEEDSARDEEMGGNSPENESPGSQDTATNDGPQSDPEKKEV